MKHYGFWCWLRRHRKGRPDMRAYALAGVIADFCDTCSRDPVNVDALRARGSVVGLHEEQG